MATIIQHTHSEYAIDSAHSRRAALPVAAQTLTATRVSDTAKTRLTARKG